MAMMAPSGFPAPASPTHGDNRTAHQPIPAPHGPSTGPPSCLVLHGLGGGVTSCRRSSRPSRPRVCGSRCPCCPVMKVPARSCRHPPGATGPRGRSGVSTTWPPTGPPVVVIGFSTGGTLALHLAEPQAGRAAGAPGPVPGDPLQPPDPDSTGDLPPLHRPGDAPSPPPCLRPFATGRSRRQVAASESFRTFNLAATLRPGADRGGQADRPDHHDPHADPPGPTRLGRRASQCQVAA